MVLTDEFKNNENKLLLSNYGKVISLGIKGSAGFIKSINNFCHNYGVSSGKVRYMDANFAFVITNKEKLKRALLLNFINELKLTGKFTKSEGWNADESEYAIEYDENAVKAEAEKALDEFMTAHTMEENFMTYPPVNHCGDCEILGFLQPKSKGRIMIDDDMN